MKMNENRVSKEREREREREREHKTLAGKSLRAEKQSTRN